MATSHETGRLPVTGAPSAAAHADAPPTSSWQGRLHLVFAEGQDGGSRLAHSEHYGPLRVQRPFYPEGRAVPHVYLLHPPGGLVPGDALSIRVEVERGAHALVTTPAAGKCYRSDGRAASQAHALRVASGASLEWLPQENIVFDGALVHLDTAVELAVDAAFVGWNLLCLGRPASGAPFQAGRCSERLTVHRDGQPLFVERAFYDGGAALARGSWGLGGQPATGTLVACPATPPMLDAAREVERRALELGSRALVGSTLLRGDVLCCRYLGEHVAQAREHFVRVWSAIRPALLGRSAVAPRIWAT